MDDSIQLSGLVKPRILVEPTLGRLARWLRLAGCDAPLVERTPPRPGPGQVLLTRRRAWAGRTGVLVVENDHLPAQLRQVVAWLGLSPGEGDWFSRCLDCNLAVEPLSRDQAAGLVPDYTWRHAREFVRCPGCGKVFWPGSHGRRARRLWEQMLGEKAE